MYSLYFKFLHFPSPCSVGMLALHQCPQRPLHAFFYIFSEPAQAKMTFFGSNQEIWESPSLGKMTYLFIDLINLISLLVLTLAALLHFAGCIEVCIMHPLDLVKTRFQIQAVSSRSAAALSDPNHYSGVLDCMKKMYKAEGLLSFWKGLLPPILVETPKRAWKVRTCFSFLTNHWNLQLCCYNIIRHSVTYSIPLNNPVLSDYSAAH